MNTHDSENEFEVDEPKEVDGFSDDDWRPSTTAKTPVKRRCSTRSESGRKKKPNVADEDIPPKKEKEAKSKRGTPAVRGRETVKNKSKKEVKKEEDEDYDSDVEGEENNSDVEDEDIEEEYIYDEEDVVLDQGPNAKPAKKFTSGAFVVLKTDMVDNGNPPVWKIDGKTLLQKYVPFEKDGKLLYKNTSIYSGWGSQVKEQYYSASVAFIKQTKKEHIIEFFKDKIREDPEVEKAFKTKMEEEAANSAMMKGSKQ